MDVWNEGIFLISEKHTYKYPYIQHLFQVNPNTFINQASDINVLNSQM